MRSPFLFTGSMRTHSRFLRVAVFCVVLGLVAYGGYRVGRMHTLVQSVTPSASASFLHTNAPRGVVDFSLFWDAWEVVTRDYVGRDELDAQTLLYGAIDGMLAATGDPYTTFFDEEELKAFDEEISGTFEGIGAEIGKRNGAIVIIAPLHDAPAQRAGLRAGDVIVKIDDNPTLNMDIMEAVTHIRGPRGTTVALTIYREGEDDVRIVSVTRDTIHVNSVKTTISDGIAQIKIRQFGPETTGAFYAAARTIASRKDVRGLIIDLRNNPGGYLNSAVAIAGTLLPRGAVVVYSEDKDKRRTPYRAAGTAILEHLPTVILINRGSASAAEILAGALRDHRDNVTLVGERSFGKGSVQELVPLKRGAVKVTIARWLTPNGAQINEVGITPDEEVAMTSEDFDAGRDPQLDRAIQILSTHEK